MSQSFSYGQRPYANISVAGKPVRFLVDTGNDVSLINHETAQYLGIPPEAIQPGFSVKGISQEAQAFGMVNLPMDIAGQTVTVPVGIGQIKDNLLGREGILDRYTISMNANQITFSPQGGDNGIGMHLPIGANYAYTSLATCSSCPSNVF